MNFLMKPIKQNAKKSEMPVWARVCAGIFGTAFVGLGIFGIVGAIDPLDWKFMLGAVGLFGADGGLALAAITGEWPVGF